MDRGAEQVIREYETLLDPVKGFVEHFTPQYWLCRADEARAVAAQFSDPNSQRVMNGIATSYDLMAKTAERIEKSLSVLEELDHGHYRHN